MTPSGKGKGKAAVALVTTHVAPARGYGGVAESGARLAAAWDRRGRAFLLCSSNASVGTPPLRPADLALPVPSVRLYRTWRWHRWGFGLGALWMVPHCCAQAKAVYINGLATWPTTLAALYCRLTGRACVIAPRGGLLAAHVALIRREKPLKWLFYRLLTLPTLRHARALHTTSALETAGIRSLLPEIPVIELGNGLDLTQWPALPARRQGGEIQDGIVLAFAGRLSPEKGIGRFLDIWRQKRRPGDRFLIAGDGTGAYADQVRAIAVACGGAVEMRGYLDQGGLRALYAEADMIVLPSGLEGGDIRENFGNAAAEALACARPLLVTRGLAWDHAAPAGAAVLFDADTGSVGAALTHLQTLDSTQWATMRTAARRLAEAELDIDQMAARLWSALLPEA